MADAFTITLIRHFPTQGNREKRYIGWTNEPIIAGVQTKEMSWEAEQIVGSDLLRCKQTAKQLFGETPYLANVNWRECSFGDWEEKTYNELKENTLYRAWLDNPREVTPPNGESLTAMENRILQGLLEAVEEVPSPIIATHGGPIRFLLTKFVNKEKPFWEWDVPHGCMYRLSWTSKEDVLEGKLCTSFSVEHLMENERM